MKTKELRVVDSSGYKIADIPADFIENLAVTDTSESIAWSGTAQIYKDQEGKYYINRHSGRSGDSEWAEEISETFAEKLISIKNETEELKKLI